MVIMDNLQRRREMTLKAHSILLKYDSEDVSGNVTFTFLKGQGITGYKIEKTVRFDDYKKNIDNSSGK